MIVYNHKKIEKKWQNYWYDNHLFDAIDFDKKEKFYALVEFPYPSGVGMHVGHIRAYSSMEVIARKRRMQGYNVLFPIGFDAFGLPTENHALKYNIHPRKVTDDNIKIFTSQIKSVGFSFDFSRVIDTTDETYYKWTQYIFLKLYEHNLVYRAKTFVNFCNECKVVLSNEESQGGKCDRCDSDVVQLEKNVWFLKITEYAEKLLKGIKNCDLTERIRIEQENWIGESLGAHIDFKVSKVSEKIKVFTTRPDTIFGATFLVISPEHEIIEKYQNEIINLEEVQKYQEYAKTKTEFERVHLNKEKTGLKIEGLTAVNPLTKKEVPIYIADYVMNGYGTGAIMAVPAHDTRDYEFAKKYNLPIIEVVLGGNILENAYTDIENGTMINSGFLNELSVADAKNKILCYIEENKLGCKTSNYKMKDWAFNRQRYWGEPIPIIYCEKCGVVPVPYSDLPVKLPHIENIQITENGESPLASIEEFVNTTCPKCGKQAKRETDTMPQWAGSSWYFLRFTDPFNHHEFASKDKLKYWGQVDWYNGGMEHVTRHLIYSRFWNQFLFDIKEIPNFEPYKKRTAQGLILGEDGEKMSKSKGTSVNPTDIVNEYGADVLRLLILFIGDYEQNTPYSENGLKGCRRFVEKLWRLMDNVDFKNENYTKANEVMIHKTIKKVSEDIENMKFNTAIAALMSLLNNLDTYISKKEYEDILKLVYPFAPHVTEELFEYLGNLDSLVYQPWPTYDEDKLTSDVIQFIIQINGKLRDKIDLEVNLSQKEVEKIVLENNKIQALIGNKTIQKMIIVPNKLINIVLKNE